MDRNQVQWVQIVERVPFVPVFYNYVPAKTFRKRDGRTPGLAARLEGIAEPGAICLSEDAYRQVR